MKLFSFTIIKAGKEITYGGNAKQISKILCKNDKSISLTPLYNMKEGEKRKWKRIIILREV